jgi:hypothetical protein
MQNSKKESVANQPKKVDCSPSTTGFKGKGEKLEEMREKICSSEDSCWNCQLSSVSRQIRQQISRERDPPCSIWMIRSPVWKRSSTLGMYILGKWFAVGVDLGTQMSLTLGILHTASASDGVTLRKVRREVVLVL